MGTDEEDESNSDDEPIVIPRKTKRKTGDGNMGPKPKKPKIPKKLKIPKKQHVSRDMNLPKKRPLQVPTGPPPGPPPKRMRHNEPKPSQIPS